MTSSSNKKTTKRTYGGLSEAERIVERRERFLEAGLELFGTVGLRGATVRALCKSAGLTERYFYESFADTEALFCAVYDRQMARLGEYIVSRLPQLPTDIDERVPAALDLYFTFVRDRRIVRVLYLESMVGSQTVIDRHHALVRHYADMAAQLIRVDNPDLQLPDPIVRCVAVSINGACNALAIEWAMDSYAVAQSDVVKSGALVVLGIMRELRSRNAKAL